jgi:hypothetical protein
VGNDQGLIRLQRSLRRETGNARTLFLSRVGLNRQYMFGGHHQVFIKMPACRLFFELLRQYCLVFGLQRRKSAVLLEILPLSAWHEEC